VTSGDTGIINIESSDGDNEEVSDDATDAIVNEITAAVGGVHIDTPIIDYSAFKTSDSTLNLDQFGHVIELYDFPEHLKTPDLMAAFQAFTSKWDIKWVDDTHALGVFSSADVAAEALAMRHPAIKSRPLNMATAQSKSKAKALCEFLLPYKQRPATCSGPARRLLQWALGSDKKVPAASKEEQDRLKEAREEKRKRRQEERMNKLDNRQQEATQADAETQKIVDNLDNKEVAENGEHVIELDNGHHEKLENLVYGVTEGDNELDNGHQN